MKQVTLALFLFGLAAFQTAASPFPSFADPEASEEYAINLLERLFPDEYNNGTGLTETDLDKRQGRRLPRPGSSFLNYHSDLPSDSVAFGGNDTDLAGKYCSSMVSAILPGLPSMIISRNCSSITSRPNSGIAIRIC